MSIRVSARERGLDGAGLTVFRSRSRNQRRGQRVMGLSSACWQSAI